MREVHETGREKGVCKNTAAERAGERRGGGKYKWAGETKGAKGGTRDSRETRRYVEDS